MKAAIFGGSFDPPHTGHDAIVKSALKDLDIDRLYIVPTWMSPFKDGFSATPEQRLAWTKRLWENLPNVTIIDYEIRQQRSVPSAETVQYIKGCYPISHLYLIVGADNFQSLPRWYRYDELLEEVEIVVANRDGRPLPKDLKKLPIHVNISSSILRESPNPDFIPTSIREEVLSYYKQGNQ